MTIEEMKKIEDKTVVVTDDQGIFTYVNSKFEQDFGWTVEEAVGQSMVMIIPENLRDAHNMGFSRFLSTETPTLLEQNLKLKAVNKSDDEFDAEHFIIAEKIDGKWNFAATIKPLSL